MIQHGMFIEWRNNKKKVFTQEYLMRKHGRRFFFRKTNLVCALLSVKELKKLSFKYFLEKNLQILV